ncbi:hypothetical protein Pcinc_042035 [Petrolisthes cinctipes]|uniref:Uncharacterized protein n=1 Tax=Petrolisthes cinctipes TaxID=88211 RepID=A0AAE1EGF8_PETCI|nr:hypothetical protein Pcinc_042035 [Petrolisthes cinctipes]
MLPLPTHPLVPTRFHPLSITQSTRSHPLSITPSTRPHSSPTLHHPTHSSPLLLTHSPSPLPLVPTSSHPLSIPPPLFTHSPSPSPLLQATRSNLERRLTHLPAARHVHPLLPSGV